MIEITEIWSPLNDRERLKKGLENDVFLRGKECFLLRCFRLNLTRESQ